VFLHCGEFDFAILITQFDEQDEEGPMIGWKYQVLRGSASPNYFIWKGSLFFIVAGPNPHFSLILKLRMHGAYVKRKIFYAR